MFEYKTLISFGYFFQTHINYVQKSQMYNRTTITPSFGLQNEFLAKNEKQFVLFFFPKCSLV